MFEVEMVDGGGVGVEVEGGGVKGVVTQGWGMTLHYNGLHIRQILHI